MRVLIVEDDKDIMDIYVEQFADMENDNVKYEVVKADYFKLAQRFLVIQDFDLLICDGTFSIDEGGQDSVGIGLNFLQLAKAVRPYMVRWMASGDPELCEEALQACLVSYATTKKETLLDFFHVPIRTTKLFWNCECPERYIQSSNIDRCPFCKAERQTQPDSRIMEVLKRFPYLKLNKLMGAGKDNV